MLPPNLVFSYADTHLVIEGQGRGDVYPGCGMPSQKLFGIAALAGTGAAQNECDMRRFGYGEGTFD
jgi:hypothetical protein